MNVKDKMKENSTVLTGWWSLVPYGIQYLTSESCAYSLRLLCDLSQAGCQLLATYFGMQDQTQESVRLAFSENWNSKVGEFDDAVASVMLPREMFRPLSLYILFHVHGYMYVYEGPDGALWGTNTPWHERVDFDQSFMVLTNMAGAESFSGRNRHQITGRTN